MHNKHIRSEWQEYYSVNQTTDCQLNTKESFVGVSSSNYLTVYINIYTVNP